MPSALKAKLILNDRLLIGLHGSHDQSNASQCYNGLDTVNYLYWCNLLTVGYVTPFNRILVYCISRLINNQKA